MRKIFIDAGGFTGDTVSLFKKNYKDHNEYEIYCFEPNPNFKINHRNKGYNFFSSAVWISDGILDFYLAENPLGSSLMKNKTGRCKLNTKNPIKVRCIDLDKWIKKKFDLKDHIVLKLDIEGAEYPVLEHMIKNGSIYYIKELFIDWHYNKLSNFNPENHKNIINFLDKIHLKFGDMCGEKGTCIKG